MLPEKYALTLVTAPTNAAISLREIRAHLRIDGIDDAEYLTAIGVAATNAVEQIIRRRLITQTWKLSLDSFPCFQDRTSARAGIEVPYPPLQSVASLKYIDTNGVQQTMTPTTDYTVDSASDPARIVPAYQKYWPLTRCVPNPVEVTFVCGYGDTSASIPAPLRHALKVMVASLYENREPIVAQRGVVPAELPLGLEYLCMPYRALEF